MMVSFCRCHQCHHFARSRVRALRRSRRCRASATSDRDRAGTSAVSLQLSLRTGQDFVGTTPQHRFALRPGLKLAVGRDHAELRSCRLLPSLPLFGSMSSRRHDLLCLWDLSAISRIFKQMVLTPSIGYCKDFARRGVEWSGVQNHMIWYHSI